MKRTRAFLAVGAAAIGLMSCDQDPTSVLNAAQDPAKILAATPQTYSTTFDLTENPISEGGKWINGHDASGLWTNCKTTGGVAKGCGNYPNWWLDATALLAGTWGPDQTVQATIWSSTSVGDGHLEAEIRLRSSLSPDNCNGYEILFNINNTSSAYMYIVRWNGPEQDFEILTERTGSSWGVKNGDVVKGTIVGNVITAYVNGVQRMQATDNVYKIGHPGMGFDENSTGGEQLFGFTDFSVSCTGGGTNAAPTVARAAVASPNPVTAKTSALSVLGSDDNGEAALTYTWVATTVPSGGAATFSVNGTNAAKNTVATFAKAGSYTLRATISDAGALTVASSVNVTVSQTLTTIAVTPATAAVATSGTQQFTASAKDQFGTALTTQPTFTWTVAGVGSITTAALYSAGATTGSATVTASSVGKSGTGSVTVSATASWVFSCNENQTVVVAGTKNVRYGANSSWNYKYNQTANVPCNNATFGDPIPNVVKHCECQDVGGSTNAAPTVATAAAANPTTVAATTSNLSVLGADDNGEAALTYTWAATTVPSGGTAAFSINGTNAAKNTVATFSKAGSYTLRATIKDAGNLTVTSSVTVTVSQTLTTITVTPSSASVAVRGTQQFTATAVDQFGAAMTATHAWTVSGGGTIGTSGLFTAGATAGGPYTVTATSGSKSGTASVTVTAGSSSHTIKVQYKNFGFTIDKFEYYNGSAWVAVDAPSTSITYSGTWTTGSCTTTKKTSASGSYAQLVFTGTGVRLYDATDNDDGQVSVYIDGVLVASPTTGLDCSAKIFEKTGL